MTEQTTTEVKKIPIKVYVRDDGRARLVCPVCGFHRELDASKFRGKASQALNARCRCQNILSIKFDFRTQRRKEVQLDGYFSSLDPNVDVSGSMTVYNISSRGIGFGVSGSQQPMVGLRLSLKFTLDNRKQSQIEKTGTVRSVYEDIVGCEFDEDSVPNGDLGFYLLG